jgi:hypothetical protein
MEKNHEPPLNENFVIFGSHKNIKYNTYEVPTPCIASAQWGDGLQAFWPSFHAWFAYPIPSKMQKMLKKGPKFFTFHQRRKLGKGYRARLGGGK